jgi:multiple sugar transport system substrate-binding protein
VPTATVVRLPVNKTVSATAAHHRDPRWTLAQQVYQSEGRFEYDSLPNWTALRQLAANDINTMMAGCADPSSAMSALDGQFQQTLQQQGVAG